ncbi:hypothetical protein GIW70_00640 [Pseudomonas syringae]|nr:hypothetical protein [Pseudomonas syringae]MCF5066703.1 hypothetical protein [Pseudomonas syringae]
MAASETPTDQQASAAEPAADLEKPKVPAVLDPDDPTGLLPLRVLGQDLIVTYTGWDFSVIPGRVDDVELGFTPVGADFRKVSTQDYPAGEPVDLPQTQCVPVDLLSQGVYDVSIKVYRGGLNPVESPKKRITIDTTKPNFGNIPDPVIFPDELNGVISESYLTQHGQVVVEVPYYDDVRVGDRAVYYWTDKVIPPDNEIEIREQEFSAQDIIDRRLLITVYADQIRPWGSGTRYMYYRLRDRAGNIGPNALLAMITVDLTPLPGILPPPRVPLPRGLIDRQQAREGVLVEIDEYEFSDGAHWLAIDWDGTSLEETPVDPAGFPLRVTVPWLVLQANGNGPSRAMVDYRIRLADGSYTPPSTDISVPVDLTIAGQDHANAPALLNMNLAQLEIRGRNSDLPNKLQGIDFGLPARALLALYEDPQPFQTIELYWAQIACPVEIYTVQHGDTAGKPLELSVPWDAIEPDLENPRLPVYYITRNGVNDQHARVTEVEMSIVVIDNLKEPTFPHADRNGVLNCCSRPRLWEGVTVHIPYDPRFSAMDEIVMYWQGCAGPNGSSPIPGVSDQFTHKLSASDAANGFDLVVEDYEKLISPMVNKGSGLVYYILNKTNGSRGKSIADFVIINRTMPSGEVCSPNHEVFCPEDS